MPWTEVNLHGREMTQRGLRVTEYRQHQELDIRALRVSGSARPAHNSPDTRSLVPIHWTGLEVLDLCKCGVRQDELARLQLLRNLQSLRLWAVIVTNKQTERVRLRIDELPKLTDLRLYLMSSDVSIAPIISRDGQVQGQRGGIMTSTSTCSSAMGEGVIPAVHTLVLDHDTIGAEYWVAKHASQLESLWLNGSITPETMPVLSQLCSRPVEIVGQGPDHAPDRGQRLPRLRSLTVDADASLGASRMAIHPAVWKPMTVVFQSLSSSLRELILAGLTLWTTDIEDYWKPVALPLLESLTFRSCRLRDSRPKRIDGPLPGGASTLPARNSLASLTTVAYAPGAPGAPSFEACTGWSSIFEGRASLKHLELSWWPAQTSDLIAITQSLPRLRSLYLKATADASRPDIDWQALLEIAGRQDLSDVRIAAPMHEFDSATEQAQSRFIARGWTFRKRALHEVALWSTPLPVF